MLEKPQPLDLWEIEQMIGEIMAKEKFPYCKVSVKARQEIMRVLLEKLIPFIKQRLKSACEFYLRYKDNPNLFLNEQKEFAEEVIDKFYDETKGWKNLDKYNEWLFKLAFKDVFEAEKKGYPKT